MRTRKQVRYLAVGATRGPHTPTYWGTCPVWAAESRRVGLTVTSEVVVVHNGTQERCAVPRCGGSHLLVPPPSAITDRP